MKRLLLLIALSLCLMGQDCEAPPSDPGYCSGSEGVVNYTVGGFSTIIGGELSTDRRAAVQVFFGRSYCSGTVIGKRTVLTAAHCGYGAATVHRVEVDGVSFDAPRHLYHPDYQKWIDKDDYPITEALEGRRSDIMLLYTDTDLPGPIVNRFYAGYSPLCSGLRAQGYGQDEFPDEGSVLRESAYRVKTVLDKSLITEQATWGGACYGDSGSALYAELGPDPVNLQIAGVLSTTATKDCLVSATYVKAAYFEEWIRVNMN